jgi:hypothetical protein
MCDDFNLSCDDLALIMSLDDEEPQRETFLPVLKISGPGRGFQAFEALKQPAPNVSSAPMVSRSVAQLLKANQPGRRTFESTRTDTLPLSLSFFEILSPLTTRTRTHSSPQCALTLHPHPFTPQWNRVS